MLYLTKKISFSAAHRLYNPTFSEDKNEDTFDKCNNFYGHGHNYDLEVTVKGMPDPETGYVYDLKILKQLLMTEIVNKVDHKHLNFDVEFLKGVIPTVENLSVIFWNILEDKIINCKLHCIRIYETPDSYVEYFGAPVEVKYYE